MATAESVLEAASWQVYVATSAQLPPEAVVDTTGKFVTQMELQMRFDCCVVLAKNDVCLTVLSVAVRPPTG